MNRAELLRVFAADPPPAAVEAGARRAYGARRHQPQLVVEVWDQASVGAHTVRFAAPDLAATLRSSGDEGAHRDVDVEVFSRHPMTVWLTMPGGIAIELVRDGPIFTLRHVPPGVASLLLLEHGGSGLRRHVTSWVRL